MRKMCRRVSISCVKMAKFLVVLACLLAAVCYTALGALHYHDVRGHGRKGYNVTYDNRSFLIDGQRVLLLSGAVHYPRVHEGEWAKVFREMYLDGLNTVQTYLYWNLHQNEMGAEYDFTGNKNWTRFVEMAGEAGLFVVLRIGPFVGSEWDYGSIPHWVNDIPGMYIRSSNKPWETVMEKVFTDMVEIARPLTAPNGGPIILAQIENEYRWKDPSYIDWCGDLVKQVSLGIPFLMCNGYSANNTINTVNGDDGAKYAEQHSKDFPGQPLVWTENEGWFQEWDEQPLVGRDNRTPQDMAFVVMKWFGRGAAHHDYYMWYGGNNFGRLAGSCVTTMYSDGVNLYSDMLPHEPKKTHLSKLTDLLNTYSISLLYSPSQVNNASKVLVYNASMNKFINAQYQFAYIYDAAGEGVAFVENSVNESALVQFRGMNFSLPGLSSSLVDISISIPIEVFNSGKVVSNGLPTERVYETVRDKFPWEAWQENLTHLEGGLIYDQPLEQLSVTKDMTDCLFYQVNITSPVTGIVSITIESRIANAFLVFVNGRLEDVAEYCTHDQGSWNYTLSIGFVEAGVEQQVTLLSVSLGINTHTLPGQYDLKGIVGRVFLNRKSIINSQWLHRAKLDGEIKNIYTSAGVNNVTWDKNYIDYKGKSVVWYKLVFDSPTIPPDHSLLLDLIGMQRGYIYVNGVNLGRYWLTQVNGVYVQRYYYIPIPLLNPTGDNLLVLIEEIGAINSETVGFVKSTVVAPTSP